MKKTKLTRSLMAACSIVALTAVMYGCVHNGGDDPVPADDMTDMEPMEPMPEDASGYITLTTEQSAALLGVLPMNGDSVELNVAADGTTRAGVTFTCASDYPCTVTVSNSAGTIVAMWASQTLGDGTASAMAAGLEPAIDTFAELNDGSTAGIRAELNPDPDATSPRDTNPNWRPTELIGMDIGGPGVLNADDAGLRSAFQANGADTVGTAAAPGLTPTLTMGTTITGAMDAIGASDDMASAPDGWGMKTLHRDWGDTAGDGDGGFETGAIVVKNLGEGTPHLFDRKLADRHVNMAAHDMFDLTVLADGTAPTPAVVTTATSVMINATDVTTMSRQWAAMVFDSTSLVAAQSQDPNVNEDETFDGEYFGAPGRFQCVSAANCGLARNADGTVGVIDTSATDMGVQGAGMWTFTPDPGAMITVPDQDWMAYGAWLTTPDDATGDHRIGVFFNGFDAYTPAENSLDAADAAGLRGSATYSGGATGVYVDEGDSGLFTADATLTADFDKATNGIQNDDTDYVISGRIDNFRGTDGVFLGADTEATPNDPVAGGENDWVVLLNAFDFSDAADDGDTDLAIGATGTGGSADGVRWTGMWNGHFFGPATDADGPIAPSGVAGRFFANTGDPDDDATAMDANDAVTSVVGAFGATKDE